MSFSFGWAPGRRTDYRAGAIHRQLTNPPPCAQQDSVLLGLCFPALKIHPCRHTFTRWQEDFAEAEARSVEDEKFDQVYPPRIRNSPRSIGRRLRVAAEAAKLSATTPATRVSDVGCGPARFCWSLRHSRTALRRESSSVRSWSPPPEKPRFRLHLDDVDHSSAMCSIWLSPTMTPSSLQSFRRRHGPRTPGRRHGFSFPALVQKV